MTRTLLDLSFELTGSGTEGDAFMGMAMVGTDALAAAALPDPEDESDHPGWLWRTMYHIFQNDGVRFRVFKDLRAQRKLAGEEVTLALMMHYIGTGTLVSAGWARVLIKRP